MRGDPDRVRQLLLGVVDNQLRTGQPPAVVETFGRLRREGHGEEDAKRLICCALSSEIYEVMGNRQDYNEARYTANLRKLPQMPWEE